VDSIAWWAFLVYALGYYVITVYLVIRWVTNNYPSLVLVVGGVYAALFHGMSVVVWCFSRLDTTPRLSDSKDRCACLPRNNSLRWCLTAWRGSPPRCPLRLWCSGRFVRGWVFPPPLRPAPPLLLTMVVLPRPVPPPSDRAPLPSASPAAPPAPDRPSHTPPAPAPRTPSRTSTVHK